MSFGLLDSCFGRVALALVCYALVSLTLFLSTEAAGQGMLDSSEGLEVWRKYNCMACHSIYGLGGHIGPDLTNTISRRNEAYATLVIHRGKGEMPNLGLSEEEAAAVVAYLVEVDGLGEYPLKTQPNAFFGNNNGR